MIKTEHISRPIKSNNDLHQTIRFTHEQSLWNLTHLKTAFSTPHPWWVCINLSPTQLMSSHTVDGRNLAFTSWYVGYPITYRVLYIPGGCLGFLPSTVLSRTNNTPTRWMLFAENWAAKTLQKLVHNWFFIPKSKIHVTVCCQRVLLLW